ncbi:hypothetical protein fHeYen801_093 [Yersinia phage fHe-Yen8-01]|nr:hypothetical protein fHeYen801_093 [Yersinia phage fHe-Yen8-01]
MERFAKVFESNGRQVLVRKNASEDDKPKLSIVLMVEGAEIDLGIVFGDEDVDVAENKLNKAFDSYGQEQADFVTDKIIDCSSAFEVFACLAKG